VKLLMISALAVAELFAAATSMRLHPPSNDRPVGRAGMISPQEFDASAGANRLPIEAFEFNRALAQFIAVKLPQLLR
jgi:hypothetical protein